MPQEAVERPAMPAEFPPGTRIARYRVEHAVGQGGMGTVYKAFDETTNRFVALKVLAAGLGGAHRTRFEAESEAEARIRHPHVMPVYDRGTFDGDRPWFAMELLYEPITLGEVVELIQRGTIDRDLPRLRQWADPARLIAEVVIPVAEGVDAANLQFGIVHRDLKPDNVLVDVRTRRPYLIDFGICHDLRAPVEAGKVVGTPRFLSPEQASHRVHPRTDVWGIGAILAFVLRGEPPIEGAAPYTREERGRKIAALIEAESRAREQGDTTRAAEYGDRRTQLEDVSFRTVEDMIRDAREGKYLPLPVGVPSALAAIVDKAMARDPEARYETVGALVEDLRAWLAGGRVRALSESAASAAAQVAGRTVRRVVGVGGWVLAGAVVGLLLGLALFRPSPSRLPPGIERVPEDLARLEAEVRDVASDADPGAAGVAHVLRRRAEAIDARLGRTREEPVPAHRARAAAVRSALEGARVHVESDPPGTRWIARHPGRPEAVPLGPAADGGPGLLPGVWLVQDAARADVSYPVVARASSGPVLLRMTPPPPAGYAWVPAPGGPRAALAIREVTNAEYADWLLELSPADRRRRAPAVAFTEDAENPGRWTVDPALADRPVVGVRPEDAVAYAVWRSEIEEATVRLPTEEEWVAAAGPGLDGDPKDLPLESLRTWRRAGERGWTDVAPHGAEGLLSDPPEYASRGADFVVKADGPGRGVLPLRPALERADPAPAAERFRGAGFRLVREGRGPARKER